MILSAFRNRWRRSAAGLGKPNQPLGLRGQDSLWPLTSIAGRSTQFRSSKRLLNQSPGNQSFRSDQTAGTKDPIHIFEIEQPNKNSEISPLKTVEAILMMAKEPISARRLAVLAELDDPTQARSIARQLNEQYDRKGHAFRIEELAGGVQILTRPQFAHWLRRLDHVAGEELLSQGMLETLSIVAYRQPVLRAEIESIRGVSCDEVLRQLMHRDLVRISGRQEELGRPFLYGTTKRFLQLFGLQSLDSLPRAKKIRQAEEELSARLHFSPKSATDSDPIPEVDTR